MAKIYTQTPLPFMGQKRRWNDAFKTALRNEFGDCTTILISIPHQSQKRVFAIGRGGNA